MSSPFEKPNPFQSSVRRFFCSGCGIALETGAATAGQWVRCPKCGQQTLVLQLDEAPPLAAPDPLAGTADTSAAPEEENPFADVRAPSAWQAIKERNKQERQRRWHAFVAVLLEFVSVAIAASAAASIGMDEGAFLSALRFALLGGVCGGGLCVGLSTLFVTGAHRPLITPYYQLALPSSPTPKGVPMIFPIALVGALAGIFTFTTLGAAAGAEIPGGEGSAATLGRALLGGALGLLPVGAWWLLVRKRAGKRNRVAIAVLASYLFLVCLAGSWGFVTGSIQPIKLDHDAFFKRALRRHEQHDWQAAIADYTKALKLDPQSANAFYNRGLARHENNDEDGAIDDFTKAIEIEPAADNAYQARAFLRLQKGDLNGAIADCTKAIELNANEPALYLTRGLALLEQGKDAEADQDFEQILKLDPRLKDDVDRRIREAKQRRRQR
jgi:hypothetical protein